jgi:hypothetical protein
MRGVEELVTVAFGVEFAEDFEDFGHEASAGVSEMGGTRKPGVAPMPE